MAAILREVVAVANAQGIALDYDERWAAITGLLEKAIGGKASMLQDVEARRQTEIEVINGAIVEAGKRVGVADAAQRDDGLDDPGAPSGTTSRRRPRAADRWRRASRSRTSPKTFPGVRALDDVSMTRRGRRDPRAARRERRRQVDARQDRRRRLFARPAARSWSTARRSATSTSKAAGDLGIGIVHQEGSLVPQLSVAENIFAGRQPTTWLGQVDVRVMRERARKR